MKYLLNASQKNFFTCSKLNITCIFHSCNVETHQAESKFKCQYIFMVVICIRNEFTVGVYKMHIQNWHRYVIVAL